MTRVFNTRLVYRTMGALLLIEAVFMLLALGVSWWYDEPDSWAFEVSTVLTCLAGVLGLMAGRQAPGRVGEREGYFIVACVWVVMSIFGLLPFYLSGCVSTITDAWFETMSGFTTTGATILPDVQSSTHSILFWRALTQWLGGMGIIVLSIAILPMFGLGGMQLYAAEVTGVSYEKLSPRIAATAQHMWLTYVLLTVGESVLLYHFGMRPFDAICHSFATISTGGFSTRNLSLMEYGSAIQWTVTGFMFLSAINFTQLIYLFRGRPSRLFKDEETRWYSGAVVLGSLALAIGLFVYYGLIPYLQHLTSLHTLWSVFVRTLSKGSFMAVSAITGTGFAVDDYMLWPPLLWAIVFFMMLTGGASGSTSGGIKWVRIGIFAKSALTELDRRIHPNAVIPVRFNGQALTQQTTSNVMAFMFFYIAIIVMSILVFCATGIPFDEAIGTSISAIGNVGASIGSFGPSGTYAEFPMAAKWFMTFVMLIGRLEIFTVLLLFSKTLWKK